VRIDSLSYSNAQTQGELRRVWLRKNSPEHLERSAVLMREALQRRPYSTSQNVAILGAGACTEVPLATLTRASEEIVLVDLDTIAMQQASGELPSAELRRRIQIITADVSGGISENLQQLLNKQAWPELVKSGKNALFDAAAACLEECEIPDPPVIDGLGQHEFGLVISSLVLSQLFSYPLLDILDLVQRIAPGLLREQERHRRYQDAVQNFRIRTIRAHLHLLKQLVDVGGQVVLLSDIRGFVFEVQGTDHDAAHRRAIPLVPRNLPDLIREPFKVEQEQQWEWLTDLPTKERPGRGYEVGAYLLHP
jgi:hypothetical protein